MGEPIHWQFFFRIEVYWKSHGRGPTYALREILSRHQSWISREFIQSSRRIRWSIPVARNPRISRRCEKAIHCIFHGRCRHRDRNLRIGIGNTTDCISGAALSAFHGMAAQPCHTGNNQKAPPHGGGALRLPHEVAAPPWPCAVSIPCGLHSAGGRRLTGPGPGQGQLPRRMTLAPGKVWLSRTGQQPPDPLFRSDPALRQ